MRVAAEFAASALFLARRTANASSEGEQRIICTDDEHERCDSNDHDQQARQQCGTVPGGHRGDRHGRSNEPGQNEERYLRPVPPPVTHAASLWDRQRRTGGVGTYSRPGSPRVRGAPAMSTQSPLHRNRAVGRKQPRDRSGGVDHLKSHTGPAPGTEHRHDHRLRTGRAPDRPLSSPSRTVDQNQSSAIDNTGDRRRLVAAGFEGLSLAHRFSSRGRSTPAVGAAAGVGDAAGVLDHRVVETVLRCGYRRPRRGSVR